MRKYNCLFFFFVMSLFVKPISGVAQLKVYKSNYQSLDSSLQQTSEKKVRLKILQAMVDDVLIFGTSNTEQSNEFYEKKLTEYILLQKEIGRKDVHAYELWLEWRKYRNSIKPDPRMRLTLTFNLINEFDKIGQSIPTLEVSVSNLFNELNEQDNRLSYCEKKVRQYTINGQKQNLAAALNGLANCYQTRGEHNRAISYNQQAIEIYKDFNTVAYINGLAGIGSEYARWGNPVKAYYFIDSALKAAKMIRLPMSVLAPEYMASFVALQLKDYQKSLSYSSYLVKYDSLNLEISVASKWRWIFTKIRMAICEANLNNTKVAQSHIVKAERLSDSLKIPSHSAFGDLEIDYAKYLCAFKMKNYFEAERYLQLALEKFSEAKIVELQKKYLTEFLSLYEVMGAYKQHFNISKRLDSLNNALELSLAPLKIANYETEQKERKQTDSLNVLKEEKAIQQAVLNKNKVMLWVSLIGILIISIALYFVYRQSLTNKKTLANLRSTQSQLIQSEKMASLGELTAGIAHEIQNPLNFVNNFSEVNKELLVELKDEIGKGNLDEVNQIADDVISNEEKINHHGKRADAIVKGMLQHSRSSSGQKEPTDINALCDEYLRLAYHGLRAKDTSFNASFETHFDDTIGKINIQPQEMGRVILNLINNAFYAVGERLKNSPENSYQPSVLISTEKKDNRILISVKDNGTGIPQKVVDKIFQPFFTTKPTGQGTGLGLSLSYDIVKAHNGELTVESVEGKGTVFQISL